MRLKEDSSRPVNMDALRARPITPKKEKRYLEALQRRIAFLEGRVNKTQQTRDVQEILALEWAIRSLTI